MVIQQVNNQFQERETSMNEQIIIKSTPINRKKILLMFFLVGLVLSTITFFISVSQNANTFDYYYQTYISHQNKGSCGYNALPYSGMCIECLTAECYDSRIDYGVDKALNYDYIYWLIPLVVFVVIGIVVYFVIKNNELTVTDKRVFGVSKFGLSINLPLDSISSVYLYKSIKGIRVSTSSANIAFWAIRNANEIYEELNKILVNR